MTRILAISDIHGHADALHSLLHAAHYNNKQDLLILLGDYTGNGAHNSKTIQYVKDLVNNGAIALKGNHEQRLVDQKGINDPAYANWSRFFSELPYFYEHNSYLFVHAGLRPGIPVSEQTADDMMNIRESFHQHHFTSLNKVIIFGHTPTYRLGANLGSIWVNSDKIGIDTGANHGYFLSLVDLSNRIQYKVNVRENVPAEMAF
ncbi:metallophosphoesterase [Gracilibacillus oryzae]|uniref:metallophosphoesterase n=1 Tax=Gracilibacillus oryzae TaxID=1672701 RepID=UPI001885D333|nr:metallophosphoesterase [Gracilibacillus oryzae]